LLANPLRRSQTEATLAAPAIRGKGLERENDIMSKWRQVSKLEMVSESPPRTHIWISDGVNGFERRLADGETLAQAIADFESAGEEAFAAFLYTNGQWEPINKEAIDRTKERTDR
jgi:hypothetical protein